MANVRRGTICSRSWLTDPKTNVPYYTALVRVDERELADAKDVELQPGMSATVMIPTKERTALDYLLGPIVTSFDQAFRHAHARRAFTTLQLDEHGQGAGKAATVGRACLAAESAPVVCRLDRLLADKLGDLLLGQPPRFACVAKSCREMGHMLEVEAVVLDQRPDPLAAMALVVTLRSTAIDRLDLDLDHASKSMSARNEGGHRWQPP